MSVEALRSSHAPRFREEDLPTTPETPKAIDASRHAENRRDAHVASYHGSTHYPPELFSNLSSDTPARHVESTHVRNAPDNPVGKTYTASAHEVGVFKTTLRTDKVVGLIAKHWPGLTSEGARTLASQWAAETGFGANCYSYNFGNVKAFSADEGHMYLNGVWEIPTSAKQEADWKAQGGVDASPEFKRAKGLPPGQSVIVFDAPNPQTRFKAYRNADDGMAAWVHLKQHIASAHPGYVDALNQGDTKRVASILDKAHYATMPEAAYAASLERCKREVNLYMGAP